MTEPDSPLLLVPGLVGGVLSLWMALVTLRRQPGPGWPFLATTGMAVAAWCFGQLGWVLATSAEGAWRVSQFQYTALAVGSVAWLLHAIAQTGRRSWLHRPATALLLVLPALTLVLAFAYPPGPANPLWTGFELPAGAALPRATRGPWFWVFTANTYLLLLGGCAMLLRFYAQSPSFRRELVVAGALPLGLLVPNMLFVADLWPLPLDPSPLGFGLGFAVFGWAMERHRLFELRPVGQRMAIDSLQDGILIVDVLGRVLEANPAAGPLLGCSAGTPVGRQLQDLLPVAQDWGHAAATLELDLAGEDARERRVQIRATPVRDDAGARAGSVLLVRDVTRERTAQQQLLAAHRNLHALNRELKRVSQTDPLTGLANRRVLVERLEQEFARARRYGTPLALLMIDLDHFKQVNDTRGHLTGDAVLRAVASALLALKRPADVAARYGGEEIVLLLPGVDAEGARGAAERVWSALRTIVHRGDDGDGFAVSASIGLACLQPGDHHAQELIARADAALYAAKGGGRDRAVIATAEGLVLCVPAPVGAMQPAPLARRDH